MLIKGEKEELKDVKGTGAENGGLGPKVVLAGAGTLGK